MFLLVASRRRPDRQGNPPVMLLILAYSVTASNYSLVTVHLLGLWLDTVHDARPPILPCRSLFSSTH